MQEKPYLLALLVFAAATGALCYAFSYIWQDGLWQAYRTQDYAKITPNSVDERMHAGASARTWLPDPEHPSPGAIPQPSRDPRTPEGWDQPEAEPAEYQPPKFFTVDQMPELPEGWETVWPPVRPAAALPASGEAGMEEPQQSICGPPVDPNWNQPRRADEPQPSAESDLAAAQREDAERAAANAAFEKQRRDLIESRKWRTWTDASGQHQVEAKYLWGIGDKVVFQRRDGSRFSVERAKISKEDLDWIKRRAWEITR
jgi:hypothetical protein